MEAKGVPLSERIELTEAGLGELDRRGVQPSALEQESAETVLDGKGISSGR